jgi:carboxymethylenebutenolidase
VPALTGGIGYNGVHDFYTNQLVGKMPADTKIQHISSTVGKDQFVDELILRFTHNREIKFMLPRIHTSNRQVCRVATCSCHET